MKAMLPLMIGESFSIRKARTYYSINTSDIDACWNSVCCKIFYYKPQTFVTELIYYMKTVKE